jgi:hypothetical protein
MHDACGERGTARHLRRSLLVAARRRQATKGQKVKGRGRGAPGRFRSSAQEARKLVCSCDRYRCAILGAACCLDPVCSRGHCSRRRRVGPLVV